MALSHPHMALSQPFHPRVSVSQICSWKWTLDEDIAFYKTEGITTTGLLPMKWKDDPETSIRKIRAAGLRVAIVSAVGGWLVAPPPGEKPALEVLRPSVDLAAAFGAPCYITTGRVPRRMPTDEAYAQLVPALKPLVDYAHSKGVRLSLEANSTATRENGFIHTLVDAVELSRDTGIEICLELTNCWVERHLARLFRDNVDRFVLVQLGDYKIGETNRMNRRALGDGDIPLEWMLGLLLEAGYQGLFEVELLGPKIEEEGYAPTIRRSVDWLSETLTRLGA
jgi:sugar phosphate isomerase/epimerase